MHITAHKGVRIFREYYLNISTKPIPLPKTAKIPVDFCTCAVQWNKKNGDKVHKFEKLAVLQNGIPIYSPFAGVFKGFSVGPKLAHNPAMQYAIITTQNDSTPPCPLWDVSQLPSTRQELTQLVQKAAIADELRHRYLLPLLSSQKIFESVLIDAVDDEPYDLSRSAVLLQHSQEVFAGAQIVAAALGLQKVQLLALKNFVTKPFFKTNTPVIQKIAMRGKYPAFPAIKLYATKTKALRIGVQACRAIYRAALFGEPQLSHTVTVWGDGVTAPGNLEVPNGTPISDILAYCKADGALERVVAGGMMTGYTASVFYPLYNWDSTVTALLLKKHHAPTPCTNCGRCAIVCPIGLAPYYTLRSSTHKGEKRASELCGEMCVHCGACSYICPARIPLEEYLQKAAPKPEKEPANE